MNVEATILSEKQVEIYKLNENKEPNVEKAKKLVFVAC